MKNYSDQVNRSAIELLELANLDSPFTPSLLSQYRRRLVNRLLRSRKINKETADYLLA